MEVGAIIVTCNSAEHIKRCLDSLSRELDGIDHSIVIVDNASTDATRERLAILKGGNIKVILNDTNVGFGAAANQAAAVLGDVDFLLIVNPDLWLQSRTIRAMLAHMKRHPSCGIAGPVILDTDGHPAASAFAYPSVGTELLKLCGVAKWIPEWARRLLRKLGARILGRTLSLYLSGSDDVQSPKWVDWISGACLLVRKEALGNASLFDDRFFLYYEDVDLCRRLTAKGWTVELVPGTRAIHIRHGSTHGQMTLFCLCQDVRSMFIYLAKHGKRADLLLLAALAIPIGALAAALTPAAWILRPFRMRPHERIAVCAFLIFASLSILSGRCPAVSAYSQAECAGNPSSPRLGEGGRGEGAGEGARRAPSPLVKQSAGPRLPPKPTVSIVMPVRNEKQFASAAISDLLKQDYEGISEILVVDGRSTDGTRSILEGLAAVDSRIRILDNPSRCVGAGLNLGISQASGDVIVRADCHARYAQDYVRKCVEFLCLTGAANVGGPAVPMAGQGALERAIAAAHMSWLGVGVARFRRPGYEGPADTVWPGAFPRSLIEEVGPFREELDRTEDVDFNSRLRAAGHRVYISPEIRVWYAPRRSLGALCRQNFANGRGVVQTLLLNAGAIKPRHLAPLGFLLALLGAGISATAVPAVRPLVLMIVSAYLIALAAASLSSALKHGLSAGLLMPIVIPCLHFSYGTGSLAGLLSILKKGPARICKMFSS